MGRPTAAVSIPRSPPRDYFARLEEAFGQAARRGPTERLLNFGSRKLLLRFATPELAAAMMPAFAHLVDSRTGDPDVEVRLCDTGSTGVAVPPFPWRRGDVAGRGEVRGYCEDGVRIVRDVIGGSLAAWDGESARGVFWTVAADRVPWYERAAPLRAVLHWSLAGPSSHLLHAAAVGDERGGVLLAGPGGAGKSTTALACLEAGIGYLGDDYVLVELEPEPTVRSLYATAKAAPRSLSWLPSLDLARSGIDMEHDAKVVLELARHRPERIRLEAPIRAIMATRLSGGDCALRPAPAGDVLRALAPSTILQHSHDSASGLALIARLARSVPCFELDLGDDLSQVPLTIERLLEELA